MPERPIYCPVKHRVKERSENISVDCVKTDHFKFLKFSRGELLVDHSSWPLPWVMSCPEPPPPPTPHTPNNHWQIQPRPRHHQGLYLQCWACAHLLTKVSSLSDKYFRTHRQTYIDFYRKNNRFKLYCPSISRVFLICINISFKKMCHVYSLMATLEEEVV